MAPNNIRFAEPFWVSSIKVQQFYFFNGVRFSSSRIKNYTQTFQLVSLLFHARMDLFWLFFFRPDFIFHRNFMAKILDPWINFDSIFVSYDLNQRNEERKKKIFFNKCVLFWAKFREKIRYKFLKKWKKNREKRAFAIRPTQNRINKKKTNRHNLNDTNILCARRQHREVRTTKPESLRWIDETQNTSGLSRKLRAWEKERSKALLLYYFPALEMIINKNDKVVFAY